METTWPDPLNPSVEVVLYWSAGGATIPMKVTVLESTLGFGNKVGVAQSTNTPAPTPGPGTKIYKVKQIRTKEPPPG